MKADLGDRMKLYEGMEAGRRLMPLLPALARIDGRAFHSFTRGMDRPFDAMFSGCMIDTTAALVRDTGACMGYTQSDEITLAWHARTTQSQIYFDGRVAKMTSQLAAQATLIFYRLVLARMPQYVGRLPTFDARVWNVPNRAEGANVFLWREWDATKNSVSMAASAHYSHKELMGKHQQQQPAAAVRDSRVKRPAGRLDHPLCHLGRGRGRPHGDARLRSTRYLIPEFGPGTTLDSSSGSM